MCFRVARGDRLRRVDTTSPFSQGSSVHRGTLTTWACVNASSPLTMNDFSVQRFSFSIPGHQNFQHSSRKNVASFPGIIFFPRGLSALSSLNTSQPVSVCDTVETAPVLCHLLLRPQQLPSAFLGDTGQPLAMLQALKRHPQANRTARHWLPECPLAELGGVAQGPTMLGKELAGLGLEPSL